MPFDNSPRGPSGGYVDSTPGGGVNPMLTGGVNGGGGGGGVGGGGGGYSGVAATPAGSSSTQSGFAGIGAQMGLSNTYNATAAPVDYYDKFGNRRGFGEGGQGEYETGNAIGALTNQNTGVQDRSGSFNLKGQGYGQGQYGAQMDAARAAASQQAQLPDVMQGYGAMAGARNQMLQQQNLDQSIKAQMAMAQSGAPAQKGLAAYNAANVGSQMQLQGGRAAAMSAQDIQAQYDQMAAQNAMQNRGMNLQQLGLSQQNAQNAAQNAFQQGQLNQQQYLALQQLQQGYRQQQLQGQEGYAQLASGNYNAAQGINSGVAGQQAQVGQQIFSGIVGAMAGGASGGATLMGGAGGGIGGGGGGGGAAASGAYDPSLGF